MSRRSVRNRLAVLLSGALVGATLTPVAAQATGPTIVTVPFGYTGSTTTWTVPAGVTSINLTVTGAQGGRGGADSTPSPPAGGYQGVVSGALTVTPGQILSIAVGAGGANGLSTATGSSNSSSYTLNTAAGGASPVGYSGGNGGAAGYSGTSGFGGAGGAATVVSTAGATIVAGGSGGSGGSGQFAATQGRVSSATYTGRSDTTSTAGQVGITIANVCQIAGASCDGGGGAGGGGGAQGGSQGGVEFGSGTSNEWFGYGGFPGQNSTGGLSGLSAAYQYYSTNGSAGSVSISYAAGGPSAPTTVTGTVADSSVPLSWTAPSTLGGSAITDYTIEYALVSAPTVWTTFADGTSTATSTTVTGLTNGTAYIFRVTGVNSSGAGTVSASSSSVTPSGPPAAPTISTISPADGSLSVAFTPATSVAPVLDYEYQLNGTGPWLSTGSTTSPVVLSGLQNGTSYAVSLRAVNSVGTGPASTPVSGVPLAAPGAPSITSVSVSPGTASVGFTPGYAGGGTITEYQYQLGGGSWVSAGTTASPIAITGLAAGTTYAIKLRAMTASSTGAASTASSITTPDVPSAPSISLTAGDGSIAIAFTPPNNNGSAVTSYQYQLNAGAWVPAGSLVSPIVVTGLTNGTSYAVRLRAINAVGTGTASSTANATPATVPGAPSIVGGTVAGSDAQLSADFTAPVSDGGSAITTYQYSTDAGTTWRTRDTGTTGTPLVIASLSSDGTTPLVNGQQYQVELRAVNAVGAGAASSFATGIAATTPSAPTISTVTAGNTTLQVGFTPGGNGGDTISRYEYQLGGTGPWVNTGSMLGTLQIAGLTNGTSYAVTVRAVNGQGNGTASAPMSGTPVTTPAQPSITGVSRADRSLTLAVNEPDNGGSAVTSWQYSTDGGATWANAAQSSSPLTITKLSVDGTTLIANGTSYPVSVRVVNVVGASIGSPTTTVGPSASPSAPVVTLTPLDESLRVSFPAPADGGSPISALEYQVGSGSWTDAGTLTSPFLITGLTNGTSYTVRLRADNAVGPGTSSAPVSAAPRTVPDAPTGVSAAVGNAQTTVSWTAPGSDGGSAITSYTASAYATAVSASALFSCTTSTTSCAITGLTNATTYYVSVVAANVAGSGLASAPRVAVTPLAPPGAPTLTSLTPGNTTLTLAFTAGSSGSSAITGYEYQLNGGSWLSAGTTSSPITISGLTNGTSYTVALHAISAVGTGATSTTLTATPYTFPDAPGSVAANGRAASADITWAAPNDNGSPITSYTATAFSAATAGSQIGTCNTSTLACTISGLTNLTTYYVSLQAQNSAGLSVRSTPRVAVTPTVVPGAVSGVTAVAGNASAQLSWTPGSTGLSAITDYTVWYSTGGAYTQFADGVSTATTATVTGLTNGTAYTFVVYPVNSSGTGPISVTSNSVTPLAPGTVPSLSATTSTSNGFTFAINNYSASTTYSFAATNGASASNSAGTVTVTGLAAGASSTVTVTATKAGETTTSAAATGSALLAGTTPTFGAVTRTVGGFSFQITNFSAAVTYTLTPTAGSASLSGSTVTVTGLTTGQTSSVTVAAAQSGYTNTSAVKTGAAMGAGTTPTFGSSTATVDGFTFTIANYSGSLVYTFAGTNGATVTNTAGSVVVTGLAPGDSSVISVTATNPGLTTATATASGSALLTGITPTFGPPIRTADGFTDTITNYQAGSTYTVTSTAGTVVSIGGSILVYGLTPGQTATIAVTVARSGYTNAYGGFVSGALDPGTTPTFSAPVSTVDGFVFTITNYSAGLVYSFNGTNGAVVSAVGDTVTVSGLAAGDTSSITVGAMDPGSSLALATVSGAALRAGVVPQLSIPTPGVNSWTTQVLNFDASATYSATASQGQVSVDSSGGVTVTGLAAGQSSDVTVTFSRAGYTDAADTVTGAALAVGTAPTFGSSTSTADGFTFTITNYSAGLVYGLSATNGAAVSNSGNSVVVTGLAPGASSVITVTATDPGLTTADGTTTGAALLAGVTPTFGAVVRTADGFASSITNYQSGATYTVTSAAGTVVANAGSLVVYGLAAGQSTTVSVTVALAGYTDAAAGLTAAALDAGTTPTFSSPVSTPDGFTFAITNYSAGLSYSFNGSNGASVVATGALVTVTGLAPGDTSTISVAASDPGVSLAVGSVDGAALLAGNVPAFGSPVPDVTSWTAQITNYDPSFTYSATATQGSVTVDGSGTITVTGLSLGQSSDVTVTSSRAGYADASSTLSGAALAAGVTPDLSSPVAVEFGFTFTINNYLPGLVYTFAASNGAVVTNNGQQVSVGGLADGQPSQITVTATDPGVSIASADVTGAAATPSSPVPTFSASVPTADGFSFDITNYDSTGVYQVLITSGGGTVVRTGGHVTVTGLTGGASATVLVAVQVNGRPAATDSITGTATPVPVVTPAATPSSAASSTPAPTTSPTKAPATTAPATHSPRPRPTRTTAAPTPVSAPSATSTPTAATTTEATTPPVSRTAGSSPTSADSGEAMPPAGATVGGRPVPVTSVSTGTGTTFSAGGVSVRLSALVDGHEVALSANGAVTVNADGQLSVAVDGFRPGTQAQVSSPTSTALHQLVVIDGGSRGSAHFALPTRMLPGLNTVDLTGLSNSGHQVSLRVHFVLAGAAHLRHPGSAAGTGATSTRVPAGKPAPVSTGAAGSAGSASARGSSAAPGSPAIAAKPPVATVAADRTETSQHRVGWWWWALVACTFAVAGGWFFLAGWRRRKSEDEDTQPA
jgi:hypothetical protein